mmetsp:Transcript_13194/g.43000  ORF Transcript_13194/g.43000 Transcript_13194/m.43000 type:complete len:261 (+) Transcript_13194:244-1026(+)
MTIVYRDEAYVAVDKPADMRIDGGRHDEKADEANVAGLLREAFPDVRFRHCHQLDYATSGCMLYALTKEAAGRAGKLFETRATIKEYLALVRGVIAAGTSCDLPICQDPDHDFKMAIGATYFEDKKRRKHSGHASTEVEVLASGTFRGETITKVLLRPKTGRRHQLRLHCRALGHPVVGDATYTDDVDSPRMMLHAYRLYLPFTHRPPLLLETPDPFRPGLLPDLVLRDDRTEVASSSTKDPRCCTTTTPPAFVTATTRG